MKRRKIDRRLDIESLLGEDHGLPEEYINLVRDAHLHNWAEGTHLLYQKQWHYFEEWCERNEFQSLPAHPAVVSVYVCQRASQNAAVSTLRTAVAAIGYFHNMTGHSSPSVDLGLRSVMRGLARKNGRAARQVKGMTQQDFDAILHSAREPRPGETVATAERRAVLDIALLSFMRDGLLRRGEAAAAKWSDLEVVHGRVAGERWGALTIHGSKTDQNGVGTTVVMTDETLNRLEEMRVYYPRRRRERMGCVFPIGERQIANRIRDAAHFAGLSGRYSGHSPRIGMVMDLVEDGVEKPSLMKEARWTSDEMISRYAGQMEVGRGAVAKRDKRHKSNRIQVRTL